jgi:hypothetical protein
MKAHVYSVRLQTKHGLRSKVMGKLVILSVGATADSLIQKLLRTIVEPTIFRRFKIFQIFSRRYRNRRQCFGWRQFDRCSDSLAFD